MRIPCPFCGDRDAQEFVYRGDASIGALESADDLYLRDNPYGPMAEHWYHARGCRQWLVVVRDTRTHEIQSAKLAKDVVS